MESDLPEPNWLGIYQILIHLREKKYPIPVPSSISVSPKGKRKAEKHLWRCTGTLKDWERPSQSGLCVITGNYTWKNCKPQTLFKKGGFLRKPQGNRRDKNEDTMGYFSHHTKATSNGKHNLISSKINTKPHNKGLLISVPCTQFIVSGYQKQNSNNNKKSLQRMLKGWKQFEET